MLFVLMCGISFSQIRDTGVYEDLHLGYLSEGMMGEGIALPISEIDLKNWDFQGDI